MKIISWNVNGVRAAVKKGLVGFIEKESPDMLALQEVKSSESIQHIELQKFRYIQYINPAVKKGYSGTMILTREKPLSVLNGIGMKEFDNEGRVQTLEFKNFYFINTYFPNSQRDLKRLNYKLDFDTAFMSYADKLKRQKPLVVCGDMNVAHEDIDIARPKENSNNAGFTKAERDWMTSFLSHGFIDTYRYFHKNDVKYSWWSYRFNARKKNIGWRIDYFIVTTDIVNKVLGSDIMSDVDGSDHAPIVLNLKL
jgi:exodeoxyribonuclease-3